MLPEKRVLGKGLSALILDNPVATFDNSNIINHEIDLNQIEPNPWQPRKQFQESDLLDLKNSIIEHGIIQAIVIRKNDQKYQIVAGERRWQASKLAGKTSIPAIIVDFNDKQMLEAALVENIQRQDLNPIEEALAFRSMMLDFEYTQETVAKKIGKSRSYIANSVRLLALPDDVQNKIIAGRLSASHARTLVGKDNASQLASEIVGNKLNVRSAEQIRRCEKHNTVEHTLNYSDNEDLSSIEQSLSQTLHMNVRIKDTFEGGILSIKFSTLEQLDILVQRLSGVKLNF